MPMKQNIPPENAEERVFRDPDQARRLMLNLKELLRARLDRLQLVHSYWCEVKQKALLEIERNNKDSSHANALLSSVVYLLESEPPSIGRNEDEQQNATLNRSLDAAAERAISDAHEILLAGQLERRDT